MIIFNLTTDQHPESFSTSRHDGRWIAGTAGARSAGFTCSIKAYAETLPEGEHLLAVVTNEPGSTPMLRLARVVREAGTVVTKSIMAASIDPESVA